MTFLIYTLLIFSTLGVCYKHEQKMHIIIIIVCLNIYKSLQGTGTSDSDIVKEMATICTILAIHQCMYVI